MIVLEEMPVEWVGVEVEVRHQGVPIGGDASLRGKVAIICQCIFFFVKMHEIWLKKKKFPWHLQYEKNLRSTCYEI